MFISTPLLALAQFGPGGVGSSASNGLWLIADSINQGNGTGVALWPDQSGNGNDAIQNTASFEPTFTATGNINGRASVTFDGSEQMEVPDAAILDGSAGLNYFAVLRPTGLNGAARGIVGKRITFSTNVQYAYTFFFYTGDRLFADIHTSNNRFNTPTTFSNNTNYLLNLSYDGSLASGSRSRIWGGGTTLVTSGESSTSLPNSDQPVAIGALNVDYGTYYIGEMAELIHYNFALNAAQRIIVENYLGAKYGIAIANDFFTHQGTYNHDVAGIGRVDASNLHNDAQGSGRVRILNPTGLGNNEYYIWGHDNAPATFSDSSDIPSREMLVRMERVWRATETGTITDFDVRFDLSNVAGSYIAEDLVLMIDTDNDGVFTDETSAGGGLIIGATDVGGNVYAFENVTAMNNNNRFTIGYTNISSSCEITSSNGYTVNVTMYAVDLIPSSMTCPFGYNYNLDVRYEITFNGSNIPANLFTLQAEIHCGGSDHFFSLPNSGGVGNVTSVSNVFTSDTDCATATPFSRNCNTATLQIEGPGISPQFTDCTQGITILPIELVAFSAKPKDNVIALEWQTATEINNDYFELQRSTDGVEFTTIAKVDGAGTSATSNTYAYIDRPASSGQFYYRLKQVDFNGDFAFSHTVSAELVEQERSLPVAMILPADHTLRLPYAVVGDEAYELEIIDGMGHVCHKGRYNTSLVTVPNISSGIYYVRLMIQHGKGSTYRLVVP